MNAPAPFPLDSPSADPAARLAYRWLLALGFPSNEAAASLMPDLFTTAPSTLDQERRPGATDCVTTAIEDRP